MQLKTSNFNKQSNKKWKRVADIALYTLPLYLSAVMALPLPPEIKLWINFGVTIITITLKTISKFTSEEIRP